MAAEKASTGYGIVVVYNKTMFVFRGDAQR
jgi:hypothetical protein